MQLNRVSRKQIVSAAALVAVGLLTGSANAETWVGGTSTDFNDATNWTPNSVPNSVTASADFNTKNITGTETVNLSSGVTLNSLTFGDAATADGTYSLTGSNITLGGTTPTITVNNTLSSGVQINNLLAGTSGLVKNGAGELILINTGNTFTGGITINAGSLTLSGAAKIAPQIVTINTGGTLQLGSDFIVTNTGSTTAPPPYFAGEPAIWIPAGQTGTVQANANINIGQSGGGAGSTLNVVLNSATVTARDSWATNAPGASNSGGNLGTLNLTVGPSVSAARFVMRPNVPSTPSNNRNRFGVNSFASTAVNIGTGVTAHLYNNSGVTNMPLGSLAGATGSFLFGGGSGGGPVVNYQIGSLNTNTEFAGTINSENNSTLGNTTGGTAITKQGTGTLTLSGSLLYTPNASVAIPNQRGGVMTVTAGTLALKNGAQFASGADQTTNPFSVVVNSGTTLSVAATTNTFTDLSSNTITGYSSQANQQTLVSGTIVGTYNHAAGVLAPGNTINNPSAGTAATAISNNAVAGTLAVNGKLYFAGSGTLAFDITPSTVSGNDVINTTDVDLRGTPTLAINRIGGATAGNYTIINSTNNIVGNATGWAVTWQGRGATPTLDWTTDPKKLQLVVSAASLGGTINWSGVNGGTWDINSTASWYNVAPSFTNPDKYFEGDTVNFKDLYDNVNAATNTGITLNSTVSPTSVVFDSSATTYSISGSGKISGATSLIKQGTSTLTLSTANDYTGGTTISGGGGIIGSIGTGSLTLNGGSYQTTTNNSTFPAITLSNSNTITTAGTGTTTMGALTGTGSLTLIAPAGTTDLTGNNSAYTGAITLAGSGAVRLGGTTTTSTANAWTINSGTLETNQTATGTLDLGSLSGTGGTLTGLQQGNPVSAITRTWSIGALNTSTTFAGSITNGKSPSLTAITKVGSGTLTLTGTSSYTGATTINTGALQIGDGGTSGEILNVTNVITDNSSLIFNRSDSYNVAPTVNGTGSVSVVGTGTTSMYGVLSHAGATNVSNGQLTMITQAIKNGGPLNVSAGGSVDVPLNGGSTFVTSVGSLSITGANSKINVHDNDLVSNYGAGPTNYTAITNQVKSGLMLLGGAGTTGILSVEVDTQTVPGTILAVVDDGYVGGAITDMSGYTIPNPTTSTLVKYTWFGDCNLDGAVDGSDYILVDTGFSSGNTLGSWVFGDFDYNGQVDDSDYILIDTGFVNQNTILPEPTTLGILGLGAIGMLRRRRQA